MSDYIDPEIQDSLMDDLDWIDSLEWIDLDLASFEAEAQARWRIANLPDGLGAQLMPDCASEALDDPLQQVNCIAPARLSPPSVEAGNHENAIRENSAVSSSEGSSGRKRVDRQLVCPHTGCKHQGTFPRNFELQRHIKTKHGDQKPFQCPFLGCFKRQNVTSFSRSDKLTDHIRKGHDADQMAKCPIRTCELAETTLDLLCAHIFHAHRYENRDAVNGIVNAGDGRYCNCPDWRCRKSVKLDKFTEHIMSHSGEVVDHMEPALVDESYTLVRQYRDHTHGKPCSCPTVATRPVCPVCKLDFRSHDEIPKHLLHTHLSEPRLHSTESFAERSVGWCSRNLRKNVSQSISLQCGLEQFYCDLCKRNNDECNGRDCWMRPEEELIAELRPFRRQLLRLCPDFVGVRAIFEDLL